MKMAEAEPYDVGVIVGRFQVPRLHEAHKALFKYVLDRHDKVLVLLGVPALRFSTKENPLDYEARKQMILEDFPQVTTGYVKDVNNNGLWSKRLDERVKDFITPSQTAVIYGGRDSFINLYSGKFPTKELKQEVWVSGTESRKSVHRASTKATEDFRNGVIWATSNKEPTPFPTVDIAIFNEDETELLLGRKPYEDKFRFPGGFVDVTDEAFEAAARRETHEELGIEITAPIYVWNGKVDDWRYRKEADKIFTTLYRCHYQSGAIQPADDLAEAKWFSLRDISYHQVMATHHPLLNQVVSDLHRRTQNLDTHKEV